MCDDNSVFNYWVRLAGIRNDNICKLEAENKRLKEANETKRKLNVDFAKERASLLATINDQRHHLRNFIRELDKKDALIASVSNALLNARDVLLTNLGERDD